MAAPEECPWQRHHDDAGTVFYYNVNTEESEWDVPEAWKDHFAHLDRENGDGADADASADADADTGAVDAALTADGDGVAAGALEDGAAAAALQQEQQREDAERVAHDAEGAEALLGLAQAAAGGQRHHQHYGKQQQGEESFSIQRQEQQQHNDEGLAAPLSTISPSLSPANEEQQQQQQQYQRTDLRREGESSAEEQDTPGTPSPPEAGTATTVNGAEGSIDEQRADGNPMDRVPVAGEQMADDDPSAAATAAGCPWIQSKDDETGNVFYYNEITQESSWDEPPEYTSYYQAAAAAAAPDAAVATTGADSDNHSEEEEEYYQQQSPEGQDQDRDRGGNVGTPSPPYSGSGDDEHHGAGRSFSSRSSSPRPSSEHHHHSAASSPRRSTRSSSRNRNRNLNRDSRDEASPSQSSPETGLSFPAFGEDYSPVHDDDDDDDDDDDRYDWQRNEDEEEAEGADGGERERRSSGSANGGGDGGMGFGANMSPDSERLGSGSGGAHTPGFAVGELSPVVENFGGSGTAAGAAGGGGAGGMRQQGRAGTEGVGKENSVVVGEGAGGKPRYSEAEMKQMVENAEKEIAECQRRLEEKDAIMGVDFQRRVTAYQSARERLEQLKDGVPNRQRFLKETRNEGVRKLLEGYKGYAQQAALVNDWLRLATDGREDTENLMLQQLKELIKTNFDAKKVDTLLDSSFPAWLTTMQEDQGWRRTLIELAREHRQSAFLRFVLKQLSDMGYHREIAAIINETDLFSVFNGVLKDALARIPGDDEVEATEALADLKRICCSTSYMFMYSQQLLIDLERAAAEESRLAAAVLEASHRLNSSGSSSSSSSRKRGRESSSPMSPGVSESKEAGDKQDSARGWGKNAAARKYKRLRQELAKHMYVVSRRADNNSSSPDGARGIGGFSFGRSISGVGGGVGGSGGGAGSSSSRNGILNGTGVGVGGTEDEGNASLSGAPSGGFLRGLEMGLSLGPPAAYSAETPGAGAASAVGVTEAAAAAANSAAKAASEAVVSMLGQAGGGGPRKAGVLSDAVDALVSAFDLKPAVKAAVEGAAAAASAAGQREAASGKRVRRPQASLVRHPTVMDILLEALFHPSHRSASEDLRAGCCALLAYASCVLAPTLGGGGGGDNGGVTGGDEEETIDLSELAETSHALMQAAGECFVTSQLASLQARLRPYAEHPLVSLGVLKWIHAQVSTEAFVSTPSFLSYAPVFLKLCGQAADEHPPQRPEVFEILKLMLDAHTAPDTPPAAKKKLKQHVLLRVAELVVRGYTLPVLEYLRRLATGLGIDPPLVGFFMVKIVGVAIPRPVARGGNAKSYSPAFLNAMAGLIGVPRVRQALLGLKPVDRERFGGYARYCLKFQRDDLTAEALDWMKQLQMGLERA
ncbi:unnamed protein product [Pylaiella littoralis]